MRKGLMRCRFVCTSAALLMFAVLPVDAKPLHSERSPLIAVDEGRPKQSKTWEKRAKEGRPGTDPSGLLKKKGQRGASGGPTRFKKIKPFLSAKMKKAKTAGARGVKKRKQITVARLETFINQRLKRRKGARGGQLKPFTFGAQKIQIGQMGGQRGARGRAVKKAMTPEAYVAELEKLDKEARKFGLSVLDDDGIKPDFSRAVLCGDWAKGRSDLKGKACSEEVIEVSSLEKKPQPGLIGKQAKTHQNKRRLRVPTSLVVQRHRALGAQRKKGSRGASRQSGIESVLKTLKSHRKKRGARGARRLGPRRFSKSVTAKAGAPKRRAPIKKRKGARGVLLPANAAEHIALLREELSRNYRCGRSEKSLDACVKQELKSTFKCAGSDNAVEACVATLTQGSKTLVKAYYEKEKKAIKAHFKGMEGDLKKQLSKRIKKQKSRLAKTQKRIDKALKSLKGAKHCAQNASKCFDKESAEALKTYLGVDCQAKGGTDCVKNLASMTAKQLKGRLDKERKSVDGMLKRADNYVKNPSLMWAQIEDKGFKALESYIPAGQSAYFKQALGCVKDVDACIVDLRKKGVDQLAQLTEVINNKSYKSSRKGEQRYGGASTAQVIIRYKYTAEASLEQVKLAFEGSTSARVLKSKELKILGVKGHFIGQPKTGKVTAKVTATVMGIDKVVAPFKEAYKREKKKFEKAYKAEKKKHKSKKGSRGAKSDSALSFQDTKSLASSEWSTGYSFSLGWVNFKVEAGLAYDAGVEYGVHLKPVALAASVAPYVMSDAFVRFAANFYVVEAGIEGRLTLVDATITFMGEIGLAGDDTGLYVYNYFAGDLDLETLSGKISAYLKLNLLVVKKKWTHKIFGWDGVRKSWRLFRFDMPRVMIQNFLDEEVPEGLSSILGDIKGNAAPKASAVMKMEDGPVIGKAMKGPKGGKWAKKGRCSTGGNCHCPSKMAVSGFRLWMQPKQGGNSAGDQRGTWRCPKGSDVYQVVTKLKGGTSRYAWQKPGCFVYKKSPFPGKPAVPTKKQVRPINADDAAVTGIQFECTSLDGTIKKVITPNPDGTNFDEYQKGFATAFRAPSSEATKAKGITASVATKRRQAWPKARKDKTKGWRRCKKGHFVVAYNVRVEGAVGKNKDDTALNDLDMLCSDGRWLRGQSGFSGGKWQGGKKGWRQRCTAGEVIRGIVPWYERVEAWTASKKKPWGNFWLDDTGLNGITIKCAKWDAVHTGRAQLERLVGEEKLNRLTLYWNNTTKDNLTWIGALSKSQRKAGYKKIRVQGYILSHVPQSKRSSFRKLVTYYHKKRKDYYTAPEGTPHAKEAVRLGYKKQKMLGWIWRLSNGKQRKKSWAKVRGVWKLPVEAGGQVMKFQLVGLADYWSGARKDHIAVGTAAGVKSTKAKRHGYKAGGNMGLILNSAGK